MIKLNGKEIIPTIFPDKTSQCWKFNLPPFKAIIEWDFESEAEFMHLCQIMTLLDKDTKLPLRKLILPYLPYARQDKEVSTESTFALTTFIKLINSLNFDEVVVFDPHSDKVLDIKNIKVIHPIKEIYMTLGSIRPDFVIYPDAGAMKRYSQLIDYNYNYVKKERNQLTGEITKLEYDFDVFNKSVLIVDDICDGGRTFITIAEALQYKGVKEINLYISHGIFSKGIEVLKQSGIKRIFTRNGEVKC